MSNKNKIINLDADVNILGNLTASNIPTQPDWVQTDETQADYIENKPDILKGSGQYSIQQKSEVNTFDFDGFGTEVNINSNDTFKIVTDGCGKTLYRGEIFYYEGALFQIPLDVNKITFTDSIIPPILYCGNCGIPAGGGCPTCEGEGKEPFYYWNVDGDSKSYHYIFITNCEKELGISVGASGNEASSKGASAAQGSRAKSSGYHTIAKGSNASAEGVSTLANERISHAEGWKTRADGPEAHAEGNQTLALGEGSHAEGRMTFAMFDYCHTEGDCTVASGEDAHAEGVYSRAVGRFSHAEGDRTLACQYGTHAEGIKTVAGNEAGHFDDDISGAHAEGNATVASGSASHAEGVLTKATGNRGSHAEGDSTEAQGSSSHAEGYSTKATSLGAHAEGSGTKATAVAAHAEGRDTVAEYEGSHAEGIGSIASGLSAHAEGSGTVASGSASHAGGVLSEVTGLGSFVHGNNLKKNFAHQAVVGQFNQDKWNVAFTVGNGTSDTDRKNAFEVYENGKVRGSRETQDGDDALTFVTKGYFDKNKAKKYYEHNIELQSNHMLNSTMNWARNTVINFTFISSSPVALNTELAYNGMSDPTYKDINRIAFKFWSDKSDGTNKSAVVYIRQISTLVLDVAGSSDCHIIKFNYDGQEHTIYASVLTDSVVEI